MIDNIRTRCSVPVAAGFLARPSSLFLAAFLSVVTLLGSGANAQAYGGTFNAGYGARGHYGYAPSYVRGYHYRHRHSLRRGFHSPLRYRYRYRLPRYYGHSYGYPGYSRSYRRPEARVYIQRPGAGPVQSTQWYYCPGAADYYPHVQHCDEPWVAVEPQQIAQDGHH